MLEISKSAPTQTICTQTNLCFPTTGQDADNNIGYELYGSTTSANVNFADTANTAVPSSTYKIATLASNVLNYEHTATNAGETWYYRLHTKNRGSIASTAVVYQAIAATVPDMPHGKCFSRVFLDMHQRRLA